MTRISHQASNARSSASVLTEAPTVRYDRRVNTRTVVCPNCQAAVGEGCVSATGKPTNHPARRRMALRAEAESYNVKDVQFAALMRPGTRQGIVRRSGISWSALAVELDMKYSTLCNWLNGDGIPAGLEGARLGVWLSKHENDSVRGLVGEAPEVVIPSRSRPPLRQGNAGNRRREPSRLDAGTLCESCGKWLPGERRLCGRCYALQGRSA